jgi:hypothetical protein
MPKGKAREEAVRVRFTAAELDTARRNAKAEGIPLSTYLRRLAVTARPATALTEPDRVRRALAALGKLSREEAAELREDAKEIRESWSRGRR